jgi:ATP-dependent Clp protease ATP-binding subunit ClpC
MLLGEFTSGQLIVADLDTETDSVTFRAVDSPSAPDVPPVELAGEKPGELERGDEDSA